MKLLLISIAILLSPYILIAQKPSSDLTYIELDSLYDLEYQNGNYQKALAYAQKAVNAAQKLENSDSLYAASLNNLANLQRELGEYDQAEKLLLEALSIQQKALGKTHSDCAETLTALVLIYTEKGKYKEAETYSLDALDIHSKNKGKESVGYAVALNNLALLYYTIEKNEEAEIAYLEVLSIFKTLVGDKHSAYAQVSSNLALVYIGLQKYKEAESLFNQVLAIYEELIGTEHPKYIQVLSELPLLYNYTRQYSKSEALHLKILDIEEKVLGKNHPEYIESLNNLAGLYIDIEKYIEAKPLLETVVSYYRKKYGEEQFDYLTGLNNLALLHLYLKNYNKSEELFLKSLKIRQNSKKIFSNPVTELNNLAKLYFEKGNYQIAIKYYIQALTANAKNESKVNPNNLSKVLSYNFISNNDALLSMQSLAHIYKNMHKDLGDPLFLEKRQDALDISILLNKKIRTEFGNKEDNLRSLLITSDLVGSILENTITLKKGKKDATSYVEAAFAHAEQNKSILLIDALKGQRAIGMGDLPDSLKIKEHLLEETANELKKEKATAKTKEDNLLLQKKEMELTLDINNFKQLLKDKYPKYNALKYENITASSKGIQALLKAEEALIEYFVAEDALYAFYIDKKTIQLYSLDISKSMLEEKVSQLRKGLTNYAFIREHAQKAFETYTKPAYWFYSRIVAPVLVEAEDIKHLIIIADGELGNLPFEAFLTKQASQKKSDYNHLSYLLHDFSISYNYSATLVKTSSTLNQRKHNGKLLAIAPTYNGDSMPADVRRPIHLTKLRKVLNPLPAAKEEIKGLEELLVGNFWYEKEANESAFKENAGDYAVIHLAMHGLLNSYSPILSSLAFTENGDSLEDNFLHAYEISKLKLNADLVVLSACETGYGKFEQGEGILSLARSFMYAGTPSLVVSLWPVNDGSTAVIMKLFYENLANGTTKAVALQQAKLFYLKNTNGTVSHPAFWSPFIQLGDSKPIDFKSKEVPYSFTYVGVGLLFLAVLLWLRKRYEQVA